jgi:putative radical SAM enzyme (TIGR03279 family)
LAVNGQPLGDLIDYLQESDAEQIRLTVERAGGERVEWEVEQETGEGLGVRFAEAVFDGVRRCHNRCVFCFVDQLPLGLRPSLYLKDDDYRLSFCQGSYVTLTNLSEADLERILKLRLSPLYVSVHATEPAVRQALLRHPRAGAESLSLLGRLVAGGIDLHTQVVLCPGWNDGQILEQTLKDLGRLGERIKTIAAVPVGVTRFRRDLAPLQSFTPGAAKAVLAVLHRWQARFFAERGTRLVFPADEFYLRTGEPIPPAAAYEEFAQLEDGVGLVRKLWDEADEARRSTGRGGGAEVHLATGVAGAKVIQPLIWGLQRRGQVRRVRLLVVPNRFFGETVTVTGLLTGADLVAAIAAARQRGERVRRVLVPETLFRSGGGVTLDDLTPAAVAERGGVRLEILPVDGGALVGRLCG